MKKLASILFLLSACYCSQAASLMGRIVDSATHEPLYGATVFIHELGEGATTDPEGLFQIIHIPKGQYRIQFNYLGYQSKETNIRVNNASSPLTVYLTPNQYELQEIKVKADKYKELKKVPSRVELITAKNIEQSSNASLADLLGGISGVQVDNAMGMFASRTSVSLRGVSGSDQSRTLILLDGMPLNKSDGGSVNWNFIDKDDIEALKIFKGPALAQYGSNAMGGVIDIITKRPTEKFTGRIKAGYGTFNTPYGSINLGGNRQNIKGNGPYWNLSASGKKSDGYIVQAEQVRDEYTDTLLAPVYLNEITTQARLGYNLNTKTNIEFNTRYFDDIRGTGLKTFEEYGANSEHDTWFSSLKFTQSAKNTLFSTQIYYLYENYQRVYEYMKEGEYKLYDVDSDRKDRGAQFDFTHLYGSHKIGWGIMGRQGSVNATDTYYTSTDIISNKGVLDTYAAYFQDEIDITAWNVQINLGLRYDYADFSDGQFTIAYPSYAIQFMTNYQDTVVDPHRWEAWSPKFSIQKRFNENSRIFFSYGKGFKAPLLDDLCRTAKRRGSFKIANPDLKPEYIHSLEVGGDYKLFGKLQIKQSTYYSIGVDFMHLVSTGDTVNLGYTLAPIYKMSNISKVDIYGLEHSMEYFFHKKLRAHFQYTYNISQIGKHHTYSAADENLTNKFLSNISRNKFTLGINYSSTFMDAGISCKHTGWRWLNDLNEVDFEYEMNKLPGYTVFDVMLRTSITKGLSAKLTINNLFNKLYIDSKFQNCPGLFITGDLTYKF